MLKNYLMVFFVSMVPVIELRGAIPIGLGMGLPALPTYLVCVLGNMLPVPFIYLFARKFLIWGYHKPVIGPVCKFFSGTPSAGIHPAVCCMHKTSGNWWRRRCRDHQFPERKVLRICRRLRWWKP